jgi:hypothetical protein
MVLLLLFLLLDRLVILVLGKVCQYIRFKWFPSH